MEAATVAEAAEASMVAKVLAAVPAVVIIVEETGACVPSVRV